MHIFEISTSFIFVMTIIIAVLLSVSSLFFNRLQEENVLVYESGTVLSNGLCPKYFSLLEFCNLLIDR